MDKGKKFCHMLIIHHSHLYKKEKLGKLKIDGFSPTQKRTAFFKANCHHSPSGKTGKSRKSRPRSEAEDILEP